MEITNKLIQELDSTIGDTSPAMVDVTLSYEDYLTVANELGNMGQSIHKFPYKHPVRVGMGEEREIFIHEARA